MANYTTKLKAWGSTGTTFPDNYSYLEGEAPVDAWDNFLTHNLISDVRNHLIPLTNSRIESDSGAAFPSSPEDGHLFYDTDDGDRRVFRYRADTTAWEDFAMGKDLRGHIGDTTNPHSISLDDARSENNSLTDHVNLSDDTQLRFGTSNDWGMRYNATGSQLEWRYDPGNANELALSLYPETPKYTWDFHNTKLSGIHKLEIEDSGPTEGLHWLGYSAQITVSDLAGTNNVGDYLRLEAGGTGVVSMGGEFRVQDGPLSIASNSHIEDSGGNVMAQNVAATGQTGLTSGTAVVDTGLSNSDATFMLALGIDDPNADAKVSGQLFWDDSVGTYKVEIKEQETEVSPNVNYDVIRVR